MANTASLISNSRRYNRLINGPTMGLERASRDIAKAAQAAPITELKIIEILFNYPQLAFRLNQAGVEFQEFQQGISQQEIAKAFRIALYSNHLLGDLWGSFINKLSQNKTIVQIPFSSSTLEERIKQSNLYELQETLGVKSTIFIGKRKKLATLIEIYFKSVLRADQKSITPDQITRVMKIFHCFYVASNEVVEYLSSLGYLKLSLLSNEYANVKAKALSLCQDTPRPELVNLLFNSSSEVRNQAFKRLADSLTTEEIEEMAPRLINIEALFSHPRASHAAKFASLKASIKETNCEKILNIFAPQMTASNIEELYNCLSTCKDYFDIGASVNTLINIAVTHKLTPLDVLRQIAQGSKKAEEALNRIIEQGDINKIDLIALRESPYYTIRLKAFFYDSNSSHKELAFALKEYLPASDQILDGTREGVMYDQYSWWTITEEIIHREYGSQDVALAVFLLQIRPEAERKTIIDLLPENIYQNEINDDLRSKLRQALNLD